MPTIDKTKQTVIAIDFDVRDQLNELKQIKHGIPETYSDVIKRLISECQP